MRWWLDIEEPDGTKAGPGPLRSAISFEITRRLDAAGKFTAKASLADGRADMVQAKRRARCRGLVNGALTDLGAGIIDQIGIDDDLNLDLSGDDLLRELTYHQVGRLTIGDEVTPATTGPAQIAAFFPTGWSLDVVTGYDATQKAIYHVFEGESCLAALCKLADITGEHFRLGTGRTVVWMQDDRPISGVRAIQGGDPIALESNTGVTSIVDIQEDLNSYDFGAGRVYAYGVGIGDARISLADTVIGVSGWTVGSDSKGSYLQHTATWNAYSIERYISFKDISDPNTLLAVTYEWMVRRLALGRAYKISVAKLDRAITVGSSIRVVYKRILDGVTVVDIDTDLVVLETTMKLDADGLRTVALKIATTDVWPDNAASAATGSMTNSRDYQSYPQPTLGMFAPTARGDMIAADATPEWSRVALGGGGGSVLTRNADDPLWSAYYLAGFTGHTYTFPDASGTVALLEVPNVFTVGPQTIQTGADGNLGLIVRANSATQSAHLQEWQNSSGTPLALIDENGNLTIPDNTYFVPSGIIYKESDRFIHNFYYGYGITTGHNTFVGKNAGNFTMGSTATELFHGSYNTALGYNTLQAITLGSGNVAVGDGALSADTEGSNNIAVGHSALLVNSVGIENTSLGAVALADNTTGQGNTGVGYASLTDSATGLDNVAVGTRSLYSNTTGSENVALGALALYYTKPTSKAISGFTDYGETVPGTINVFSVGHGLPAGTTPNILISGSVHYNDIYTVTRIDNNHFYCTATWEGNDGPAWWSKVGEGDGNIAVGTDAGMSITRGSYNIFIGYDAGLSESQKVDAVDSMALGNGVYTDADHQLVIGNTLVEFIRGEVGGGDPQLGFLGAAAVARQAHVANPTGGSTVDAEARSAINSILATLENFGFHETS